MQEYDSQDLRTLVLVCATDSLDNIFWRWCGGELLKKKKCLSVVQIEIWVSFQI